MKEKYRFEHAKIREVLYAELSGELKNIYHEIVAKVLEEEYKAGRDEILEDVVYHYSRTGLRDKVIEYGLVAGRTAKKRFANAEAIRIYTEVLNAMGEDTCYMELRLQTWWELAEVLELAGRYDEALEILKCRIANLITTDPVEAGRSYRKRCEINIQKGDYEKAIQDAENAEQVLSGVSNANLELARVWSVKGYVLERRGEYRHAIELQERAIAVFERVRAEKDIGDALHRIGSCYWYLGESEKGLEYLNRALKHREEINDVRGLAATYNNIGAIYHNMGDSEKALEFYLKSLALKERLGDVYGIATSYNNLGVTYHNKGDYEKALEFSYKSLTLKERIGDLSGIATAYHNIGGICFVKGEYEKAIEFYKKALLLWERSHDTWDIALSCKNFGDVYLEIGEYERALESYSRSLQLY